MTTRKLTYTAFFIALGIILPQAFHMVGGPGAGSIFLPIHLPVLIGAMILGPISGMLIAAATILVGVILGMPPMPIAIFMFFEMMVYGFVAGYMVYSKKLNVYVSLVVAMVLGRVVELGTINLALRLFEVKLPPIFGNVAMFAAGLPGMVIQLVLVPILVLALTRFAKKDEVLSYD